MLAAVEKISVRVRRAYLMLVPSPSLSLSHSSSKSSIDTVVSSVFTFHFTIL